MRDEDRAHAHPARAVNIVERPVADEHARRRVGHPDRGHRRQERLRVRLGIRDLAAVDRPVDQLEHPVALEHPLVQRPRPHRVGKHPDLDRPLAQQPQQRRDVRVGVRVRRPLLEVGLDQLLGRGDPGGREDVREGGAAVRALALRPAAVLRRQQRRRDRRGPVGREVRRARLLPQCTAVNAVPRRQRPAPVEDDRPHRHERQHSDASGTASRSRPRWRRRSAAPWGSPGRARRRGTSSATPPARPC